MRSLTIRAMTDGRATPYRVRFYRRSRFGNHWLFNDHVGIGGYRRYYLLTVVLYAFGREWWLRIPRPGVDRP